MRWWDKWKPAQVACLFAHNTHKLPQKKKKQLFPHVYHALTDHSMWRARMHTSTLCGALLLYNDRRNNPLSRRIALRRRRTRARTWHAQSVAIYERFAGDTLTRSTQTDATHVRFRQCIIFHVNGVWKCAEIHFICQPSDKHSRQVDPTFCYMLYQSKKCV